jgi:hypothetical protein
VKALRDAIGNELAAGQKVLAVIGGVIFQATVASVDAGGVALPTNPPTATAARVALLIEAEIIARPGEDIQQLYLLQQPEQKPVVH